MHCPVCSNTGTRVVDSRAINDGMHVRRRRECEKASCAFRFSTLEEIELLDIAIIKRDGEKQPYSKEKLSDGLTRALQKRPYNKKAFQRLILDIERDKILTSAELGDVVIKHLKKFDKVAYIRFASVYYSFEDLEMFEAELGKLTPKRRKS